MAVTLADLKEDLNVPVGEDRDDGRLQMVLDAALAFVREVRADLNWDSDPESDLPAPTANHELGVLRLAGRWHTKRRSPDGLIEGGELGTSQVPSVDPDVARLLGVGRYRNPVVA